MTMILLLTASSSLVKATSPIRTGNMKSFIDICSEEVAFTEEELAVFDRSFFYNTVV